MKIKICFTGGGTAGHVYPGISVLDCIAEKGKKEGFETDFFLDRFIIRYGKESAFRH